MPPDAPKNFIIREEIPEEEKKETSEEREKWRKETIEL